MATWLKQSTNVEIKLGPFLDETDGATAMTGLTIEDEHVDLAKNGGDWGDKNETTTLVHESQGWYRCLLNTTDTDTLGILIVKSHVATALPVWREFMVLPANVYDALVAGSDLLQVDAHQIEGADASDTLAALDDAILTQVALVKAKTDNLPSDPADESSIQAAIAALDTLIDAIKAKTDNLPSDPADASVVAGLIAAAQAVLDKLDDTLEDDGGTYRFTENALEEGPGGGSAPTAGEVADAVWDEALSGHLVAGSTGAALNAASAGSVAGAGAISWVVQVRDAADDPVQGAAVWVSTDEAGTAVVAGSLITPSSGDVTFLLDAGTYYVRVRKDGFNPVNGEEITVS